GLVVGGAPALAGRQQDPPFAAEHDLLQGVGEVGLVDRAVVASGSGQGGLVDQVGQFGPDHARGGRGDRVQVDIVGQRHPADVDLQDLAAGGLVGGAGGGAAGAPAGAQQGRVEDLGPVGGGQHDHVLGAGEAVHLGQDLVEGLLALGGAAHAAGPATA